MHAEQSTFEPIKPKTQTLRGKFQLKRNIFASCLVDVVEASGNDFKAFIGTKTRKDTVLPVGTRLFFNAESIHKITARRTHTYDLFSVTIQEVEDMGGQPLHICTPILKETHNDMRAEERMETEFSLTLEGLGSSFIAVNGTAKGLKLLYQSKKAVLSVKQNQNYTFSANYKNEKYLFSGHICHIQYDWKTHEHFIGVHFPKLTDHEETILNLLINPNYKVEIKGKDTVDTAAGKISRDS